VSFTQLLLVEYFLQFNITATITGSLCPMMTAAPAAAVVFLSSAAQPLADPSHAVSPRALTACAE